MKQISLEQKKKINLFLFGLIVVLFVILVLELVYNFYLVPNIAVQRIILDSRVTLSDRDVYRAAGLDGNLSFFSLDLDQIEEDLLKLPEVRSVVVEKRFPDALYIRIDGRSPVGLSLVDTGSTTVPVVFDQEGIIYQIGGEAGDLDLPVVSGVRFEQVAPGTELPDRLLPLLDDLVLLKRETASLYALISEIVVIPTQRNVLDLRIYLSGSQTPALISSPLTAEKLRQIIVVTDALRSEGLLGNSAEIDFRSDEIVFNSEVTNAR